jgi:N-acetylmuramic acid 6-phosphate etherase
MTERATEARHPAAPGLHLAGPEAVLEIMCAAQLQAIAALRPAFGAIAAAADAAARAIGGGHRVIYAGAGSSGLMALSDCLELAGTFGIAPDRTPMLLAGGTAALLHMTGAPEDDPALAEADLATVAPKAGDVVLAVSASGSTPYTVTVARAARARGALVVGIASAKGSPLLAAADVAVFTDTGAEVIAGSTRLGAATAHKVALNMISVLAGIRLGHVHDGMMVNLVADNTKLVDRAARIVATVSGSDADAARRALAEAEGVVKPAILIARGASLKQAKAMLEHSRGHIGPALDALKVS